MELREVMGRRRSIRFLLPYKPVEPEKIQRMLEAARIASHWGNVQSLRAIVVFRDSAPQGGARRAAGAGRRLPDPPRPGGDRLVHRDRRRRRAVGPAARAAARPARSATARASEKALEETADPDLRRIREGLKLPGLGEVDCGQGIAQATLMAFEQGLGTCCLGTPNAERSARSSACPTAAGCCCCRPSAIPPRAPRRAASARVCPSRSSST